MILSAEEPELVSNGNSLLDRRPMYEERVVGRRAWLDAHIITGALCKTYEIRLMSGSVIWLLRLE